MTFALKLQADTAYLTGATPKLDSIVQFHVGPVILDVSEVQRDFCLFMKMMSIHHQWILPF